MLSFFALIIYKSNAYCQYNEIKNNPESKAVNSNGLSDILYIILPYFNFSKSKNRKSTFMQFVNRYSKNGGVKIVIAEASANEFDLPRDIEGAFQHHRFKLQSNIWCKENLVNVAVSRLPSDWMYVSWIDIDIIFLNEHWAQDAVAELKKSDFIQLFHNAVDMGSRGEALRIKNSFAFMHKNSKHEWRADNKYGIWHPGFAWACTRSAFEEVGGLLDISILGGGDRLLALALVNMIEKRLPPEKVSFQYTEALKSYEALFTKLNLTLSYINGTILHQWHGSFRNRNYDQRFEIFFKHKFNPYADLEKNGEGILNLSKFGKRMKHDIDQYFLDRKDV